MDLQKVKDYLRVDYEEDDGLIGGLVLAAEEYLKNAGVQGQEDSDLYEVVVLMLTGLFYESRGIVEKDIKIPSVINNFIVQLSCKRG